MRKIWICFKNLINPHHNQNSKPMFVKAIEEVKQFTRPIHTIVHYYGNDFIIPSAATLFFVNENAVAITCKHVLVSIVGEEQINQKYQQFKNEKLKLGTKITGQYKKQLKELEVKFGYIQQPVIAQIKNTFMDCVDTAKYEWYIHPEIDLAIIKFKDFQSKYYTSFATFAKDSSIIKQGKYLCRYGYPFVEFTNYTFDKATENIDFTNSGNISSPSFPIEGMVTRHVTDGQKIVGIEISTPGLRGQSGGPLFDQDGLVSGMQSETCFYHLGFDEKKIDILSNGKIQKVLNNSFINVGRCVHVDIIKDFLRQHNIKFYEK